MKNSTSKLGMVILNYNDSQTTIRLAKLVENYSSIDSIVVVDNCSSDDSFKKLLDAKLQKKCKVIQTKKNGGYGYGNNYGIKYINDILGYEYSLIANPDTEITDRVIDKLKNFMDSHIDCVVAAPLQRLHTETGKIEYPWYLPSKMKCVFSSSVLLSKLFFLNRRYDFMNINTVNREMAVDVVPGALLMINTKFFMDIGGYDEDIFLYNEENCLAMKVKKKDKKSYVLLDCHYIHHHSVSIDKTYNSLVKKRTELLKSKLIYLKKYYSINKIEIIFIKKFFSMCIFESKLIGLFQQLKR